MVATFHPKSRAYGIESINVGVHRIGVGAAELTPPREGLGGGDANPVSVANISIPWGRERLTDDVQGNAWTLDLALLPGNKLPHLVGETVQIKFVSGAWISGKITKQSISVRKINEVTDASGTRDVMMIRLVVRDLFGMLATTHLAGDAPLQSPWPRGWKPQLARVRAEYIRNKFGIARAEALPSGNLPTLTEARFNGVKQKDGTAWTMQPPYKADSVPDALAMLASCYAAAITAAWPVVHDGGLKTGRPGAPGTLALALSGGQITLSVSGCTAWPAERLEIDPTAFPQTDFDSRIGRVLVTYTGDEHVLTGSGWTTPYNHSGVADWSQSGAPATFDAGELFYNGGWSSGAISATDPGANSAHIGYGANGAHRRGYELADWLFKYSVLPRMPKVTISTKTGRVADHPDMFTPREFLNGANPTIYLQGSIWNSRKDIPRFWQSVGGEYREDDEHAYHDIQLAPVYDTKPRDLTISQLFPKASAAPLKFAPHIRLSDIAAATESRL